MLTETVNECVKKAMSDSVVKKAIEKRDKDSDVTIESIYSKIMRRKYDTNYFAMVVRVSFDYLQRIGNIKEDIWVDVIYYIDKRTGAETYDVKSPVFVPELPNS